MATKATTKTTAKATTTTKATATKAKATTSVENTATTEMTNTITANTELTIHGYKVLGASRVKHTELNRGYNLRSDKNVKNVTDLTESIKNNGVTAPIHITPSKIVLDGFRRLETCDVVATAISEDALEVPVIIVDVPLEDIPLYQHRCGLAKGVSEKEHIQAIVEFAVRNPKMEGKEIAVKFAVSETTVSKAIRLHREAPALYEKVTEGTIAQKAALEVIATAKKEKLVPDELGLKVIDTVVQNNPDKVTGGLGKPITKKQTDKALKTLGIEPAEIPIEVKEEKDKVTKTNPRKLLEQLWKELQVSEGEGNMLRLSGYVSRELISKVESMFDTAAQTGMLTKQNIPVCAANPDEFYSVWLDNQPDNGDLHVLQYKNIFYTYEDTASQISDITQLPLEAVGGLEVLRAKNLNINVLLERGLDVRLSTIIAPKAEAAKLTTKTKPDTTATESQVTVETPVIPQASEFHLVLPTLTELIANANKSAAIVIDSDTITDDDEIDEEEIEEIILTGDNDDENSYANLFN